TQIDGAPKQPGQQSGKFPAAYFGNRRMIPERHQRADAVEVEALERFAAQGRRDVLGDGLAGTYRVLGCRWIWPTRAVRHIFTQNVYADERCATMCRMAGHRAPLLTLWKRFVMVYRVDTWADEEFGDANLGDLRRTERLKHLASVLMAQPSASIPAA